MNDFGLAETIYEVGYKVGYQQALKDVGEWLKEHFLFALVPNPQEVVLSVEDWSLLNQALKEGRMP